MNHRALIATVGLLLAVAAGAAAENIVKPLRDDDVVARVNGTPIYRKSVRDLVQAYLLAQDTQPDAAQVDQLAADALDSLIGLELLYEDSAAKGITISDTAVDEEIGRNKSRFPDPQAFGSVMKEKGMTEADLRRDTRKTMAVSRLLEGGVLKDVNITPEQVQEFYEHNKEEFKHPAQVRASHILLRVPEKASAGERAAIMERATALLGQLKTGADFARLAQENSQDPVTAPHGGDLGYFSKGEMDNTFEKAAFALSPGQISAVVSTPYGLHIIKSTGRREAGYDPLPEVEDRIKEVLLKSERQRRQAEYVATLRKKAKVELLDGQK